MADGRPRIDGAITKNKRGLHISPSPSEISVGPVERTNLSNTAATFLNCHEFLYLDHRHMVQNGSDCLTRLCILHPKPVSSDPAEGIIGKLSCRCKTGPCSHMLQTLILDSCKAQAESWSSP